MRFVIDFIKNNFFLLLLRCGTIFFTYLIIGETIKLLNDNNLAYWLTLASFLTWFSFADLGVSNAFKNALISRYAEGNYNQFNLLCNDLISLSARRYISAFLIISGVSAFVFYFRPLDSMTHYVVFFLGVSLTIVKVFSDVIYIILSSMQIVLPTVASTLISLVSSFVYILYLRTNGADNFIIFAAGLLLLPIFVNYLCFMYYRNKKLSDILFSFHGISNDGRKLSKNLGRKFFLVQILYLLLYSSTSLLVANTCSTMDVSSYNLGLRYYNILFIFIATAILPIWPSFTNYISRGDLLGIQSVIRTCWLLLLICFVFGITLLLCSDIVFHFWTAGKHSMDKALSITLLLFTLTFCWNTVWGSILNAIGMIDVQLKSFLVGVVIYLGSVMILCILHVLSPLLIALCACAGMLINAIVFALAVRKYLQTFTCHAYKSVV
jgi:O-antigen/teichoic acid export membrane protein